MERPPGDQKSQPPADFYAPRVRDFQPDIPPRTTAGGEVDNVLPPYAVTTSGLPSVAWPWGPYRSEQEYLDALKAFVQEKEYQDLPVDVKGTPVGLIGFYGSKTSSDYINQSTSRGSPTQKRNKKDASPTGHSRHSDIKNSASATDAQSKPSLWQRLRRC